MAVIVLIRAIDEFDGLKWIAIIYMNSIVPESLLFCCINTIREARSTHSLLKKKESMGKLEFIFSTGP
jgi:hypothetical protein